MITIKKKLNSWQYVQFFLKLKFVLYFIALISVFLLGFFLFVYLYQTSLVSKIYNIIF